MENTNQPAKQEENKDLALTAEQERDMIAKLRQGSGEGLRMKITYVGLSGRDGKYYRSTGQKDPTTLTAIKDNLGETYEGIIIKTRCRVNVYNSDDGPEACRYSSEFDSTSDEIIKIFDGNRQLLGEGTYQKLKILIPDVSMEKVLYIKENGSDTVVKMSVKGASMAPFFDYLKTFPADDTVSRYVTKFGAASAKHKLNTYFVMTFTRGEQQDIREVFKMQKALEEAIGVLDTAKVKKEMYENLNTEEGDQGESQESGTQVLDADEIKVDDIPF